MKLLEDSYKGAFAAGYVALLLGALVVGVTAFPRPAHAATNSVGLAIPLYTYPTDASWAAVIQEKQAYPNVPFIAVINPNSGPGTSSDPNYAQGIKNLQAAGVLVLGYVATSYAANGISSLESQVSDYQSWYGVNGIFFDEMSNSGTTASYYSTLDSYVHSLIPGSTTMGNPGTSVPTSLIGTLDILCIYESSPYPSTSYLTFPGYPPSDFSNIVYGVAESTSFLSSLVGVNSWTYLTDANLPNPYEVLPSYFTSEVAELSALDTTVVTSSSSSTSSTTTSSGSSSLTVSAVDLSGSAIAGMWTTWNQNGSVLASGYTPMTYSGTTGGTYMVTVANYGSTVFCNWQNGGTSPDLTLVLTGNLHVTAVYSTSGSCPTVTTTTTSTPPSTTTTTTTTSTTSTTSTTRTTTSTTTTSSTSSATSFPVTIKSATSSGAFSGMWTVVTTGGTSYATGYTPLAFTATSGHSYTITVSNYGNYVFSHWSTGSTSATITITPKQAMTLTAIYILISCPPNHKHC